MPDFSIRSYEDEIMDDLDSSGQVIEQTLRELEFINKWLGGNAVTINALNRLLKNADVSKALVIADLGCGSGDMLKLIHAYAMKRKIKVKLIGFDANPHIVDYARKHLDKQTIEFQTVNIFDPTFSAYQFDIVIGTLFFHHFDEEQLIQFFSQLKKQVSLGIIINDIHRHPLAYYSIAMLTRWFSRSPMVTNDAPLSVLRAFSKEELVHIIRHIGVHKYDLRWRWAFRWQAILYTTA